MSELWVYMNGHVTGIVQPDQGQHGHQNGKKRLISSKHDYKQKFKIDLNQNFEIPRVRTLRPTRINSFGEDNNVINHDSCNKKSRTIPESNDDVKERSSRSHNDNDKDLVEKDEPMSSKEQKLSVEEEEPEDNIVFVENEADEIQNELLNGFNKILETASIAVNTKKRCNSEKEYEETSKEKWNKARAKSFPVEDGRSNYSPSVQALKSTIPFGRTKARKQAKKKVKLNITRLKAIKLTKNIFELSSVSVRKFNIPTKFS